MIKLLILWAAWRAAGVLAAVAVIAMLALLLLGGVTRTTAQTGSAITRLKHATRPVEQRLERTLEKTFKP